MGALVEQRELPEKHLGVTDSNRSLVYEIIDDIKDPTALFMAIPMVCRAEDCVLAHACRFMREGRAPRGERCAVEIGYVLKLFDKFVEDLNANPNDLVELSIIRDIVNVEIRLMRVDGRFGKEGDIETEVIVGIDDAGNNLTKPELSNHVIVHEKLMKEKRELLKMMSATREEKYKNRILKDPSSKAAELMARAKVIDAKEIEPAGS